MCIDFIAPGTLKHIGEKCVHLASTNMTTGRSRNTNDNTLGVGTEWSDFSELVKSHKADLVAARFISALLDRAVQFFF